MSGKRVAWVLVALLFVLTATLLTTGGCGSGSGGSDVSTTLSALGAQGPQLYPVSAVGTGVGYIDKTGKTVIPAQFAEGAPFSEGLAAVRLKEFGPWGYIDTTGSMVIEPQFAEVSVFSGGLAAVRVDVNGSWGFTDTAGALAIPPQFAAAHDFSEGVARVRLGQESGYVDTKGEWVIRMTDHEAVGEFSGGLALVYERATDLYGYIDLDGKVAIAPAYGDAWGFSEGLAAARLPTADQFGYIDKHGDWAIQPQFADAAPFSEGLAAVQNDSGGAWGYVDVTASPVIQTAWEMAEPFRQAIARVARRVGDSGTGYLLYGYAYIDMSGKVIWRDQALTAFEAGVTTTTTPDPVR